MLKRKHFQSKQNLYKNSFLFILWMFAKLSQAVYLDGFIHYERHTDFFHFHVNVTQVTYQTAQWVLKCMNSV